MDKLYIVVRADLEPGAQLAQSCHAAVEFGIKFPEMARSWYEQSNYIVVLAADTEEDLRHLIEKIEKKNLKYLAIYEPDLDNALTAVVIEPNKSSRRIVKSLPLALSNK